MTEPTLYPEEPGYRAYPGFVKAKPENNAYYLSKFKGDPWYPILLRTDAALERLIPGYNIAQIKEKFGGLRYYIGWPAGYENTPENIHVAVNQAITYAEGWVAALEYESRVAQGKASHDEDTDSW